MRSRQLMKNLKKALKQDYLYNEEELIFMKKQLRILEEEIAMRKTKEFKGFGK